MANDMDFIGFSYNGKHSYTDFKIYRTSDGSRYNDNLIPQLIDKTADVPGGDGQYFFRTNYKTRQIPVSIAFDNLTESKYREMRQWLDGQAIHDLIFDELPYKVYSAKVAGIPQLKTVCFEEDGQRVYKGEGII
jgi:predicted phage tail component-like protein